MKISRPIIELVEKVSTYLDAGKDEVLSGNRRQKNCHARDLISFVAAKSIGYKINYPAASGRGILNCKERRKRRGNKTPRDSTKLQRY